jgi:hypothetical protein
MTGCFRAARLVAWTNAVLAGRASPDLAAACVVGGDPPHRVVGVLDGDGRVRPLLAETLAETLPVLLARLAGAGQAPTARLLLPVPGDPTGLPGPGPFTDAALAAGEAAVLPGPAGPSGLVPQPGADGVRWVAFALDGYGPPALPSLAEADRALALAVREATDVLLGLDVARSDDADLEVLDAVRDGRLDGDGLAPGYPARAVAVLSRARRLRTVVAVAAAGDGAAVTARESALRAAALRPLDHAARLAEMAAYNVLAEREAGPGR